MLFLVLSILMVVLLWVWIGSSIARADAGLLEPVDKIMSTHFDFGLLSIFVVSLLWPARRKAMRMMYRAYERYCLRA